MFEDAWVVVDEYGYIWMTYLKEEQARDNARRKDKIYKVKITGWQDVTTV